MWRIAFFLKWLILLPILIVVVLLAVANDQIVPVHLNPFDPADPVLRLDLALYQVAFAAFALGAICGGMVVWSNQRKYRRQAHNTRKALTFWQARAESSERQAQGTALVLRPERS